MLEDLQFVGRSMEEEHQRRESLVRSAVEGGPSAFCDVSENPITLEWLSKVR
jgi:hypothetical protein